MIGGFVLEKRKNKQKIPDTAIAPGIDPEESYGKNATKSDIERGESTPVIRLVYDEYHTSGK